MNAAAPGALSVYGGLLHTSAAYAAQRQARRDANLIQRSEHPTLQQAKHQVNVALFHPNEWARHQRRLARAIARQGAAGSGLTAVGTQQHITADYLGLSS